MTAKFIAILQSGQVIIVQQISAIDAAVRFLHWFLSAATLFSVIHCLPAVFPHFVTPDRHRSLVLFNTVHPSFLRSSSWWRLLTIHNTCPNHFNRIYLLRLDIGTCCLIVSFVMLSLYAINPHNSSEPAIFTGIKLILHVFGKSLWLTSLCEYWENTAVTHQVTHQVRLHLAHASLTSSSSPVSSQIVQP